MSNTPLSTCPKITKFIFVFFNILFLILGLVIVGVGAWLVAENNAFVALTGNSVVSGAALIIVAGGVTVIIAAVGILGALCQARPLLVIFAVTLIIIVILEIVGAGLAIYFRNNIRVFLDDGFKRAFAAFSNGDSALDVAVNAYQNQVDCCGAENYTDWMNSDFFMTKQRFPDSCCRDDAGNCRGNSTSLRMTGCIPATIGAVTNNVGAAVAVGGIALAFGFLEVAGIVLSLGLCCCIHRSKLTLV